MTFAQLAFSGVRHFWRTHLATMFGVAAAVAVLAGSLLVGTSVRASLASIATDRLGRTAIVVSATQPFAEDLASRLASAAGAPAAPLLVMTGAVRHDASSRRSSDVQIYGVDDRFFAFHGVEAATIARSDVWLSTDLAAELGAAENDAIVLRMARPTDIPIDSLHGRREEPGRTIRLTSRGALPRERMGTFSLAAGQGPARAVFVSLARLQRDLDLAGRVNTLLVGGNDDATAVRAGLERVVTGADLGLKTITSHGTTVVESSSGLLTQDAAAAISDAASRTGRRATPVLSWLANRIILGDRAIPYSLVTAIGPDASADTTIAQLLTRQGDHPPVVLNEWAASDLKSKTGDLVELEYYRWLDEGRLVTERAQFRVAGHVPMRGLAVDRTFAPDYPGITTATSVADWDPPFPIDLNLIRPQDERYWDDYRSAPKAFIPLDAGQKLWGSRHGQLTSVRVAGAEPFPFTVRPLPILATAVRAQRLSASAGATDFGAYFSYFSFFLMVAALLLAALFFRLSIEQRASQIGLLRAAGFTVTQVRRVFLLESAVVVAAGAVTGAVLAVAWAALMMYALRTWWIGAVGTTLLRLHVDGVSLAIGTIGAALAALISIALTIRSLNKATPRSLLTGATALTPSRHSRGWLPPLMLGGAVLLSVLALAGVMPAAAGFFGAGALVLGGGLALFGRWLASGHAHARTLVALGLRNASWRPGRSLTAAGLVASAVFLLVSVDSFRKSGGDSTDRSSGTGGFALIAESALPVVHDLQTAEARRALGFSDEAERALQNVSITGLRLRPGDDASCLNLYQPKQPRLLGVPSSFASDKRFAFARVVNDASAEARANPWLLLDAGATAPVPAIVDATSLQYVLHAAVGDTITIDADTPRPIELRIVASLDDSVLQGEVLIGEAAFRRLFPEIAGYRVFLVDTGQAGRADDVSRALEEALDPFGFDAQSSTAKLEAFHRVENTYLSTFQALGGLGLVLGCLGLVAVVARNILERRRELALLGAAGFTGRDLQRVVAVEHVLLVGAGLAIGLLAAAVATAPVIVSRTGAAPWQALIWVVPVALAGLAAAYGATRSLRRLRLVESLRSE